MNSIEEKLWNYIDGTCTPDEQAAIRVAIESDEVYRQKYNELLELNSTFSAMEIEEPPMAFTFNVMETIRNEHALKPLKASIDKRIIKGLTGFFAFTILALVVFVLVNMSWSSSRGTSIQLPVSLQLPDIKSYLTSPVINAFLFFDLVLGLFLFDAYLRRRNVANHA